MNFMERIRLENELADLGLLSGREFQVAVSQTETVRICLIDPTGRFKDYKRFAAGIYDETEEQVQQSGRTMAEKCRIEIRGFISFEKSLPTRRISKNWIFRFICSLLNTELKPFSI